MHPLVIIFAVLTLIGITASENFENLIADSREAKVNIDAGRLKAYGSYVRDYRDANPSFSGTASPAAAGMPTWLSRLRLSHVINGGTAYVFMTVDDSAQALAIASRCGQGLRCGVNASGVLRSPGIASGPSISVPSTVPNGAAVLVF